jgi:hypothetical protein
MCFTFGFLEVEQSVKHTVLGNFELGVIGGAGI